MTEVHSDFGHVKASLQRGRAGCVVGVADPRIIGGIALLYIDKNYDISIYDHLVDRKPLHVQFDRTANYAVGTYSPNSIMFIRTVGEGNMLTGGPCLGE